MALAPMFEHLSDFSPNQATVLSILYLSIFGTVVTFIGYYWLLSHMRAVVVSLIAFITPIVAIFIGVTFLSESLTPLTIVGTGVILIAVLLVVRDRST